MDTDKVYLYTVNPKHIIKELPFPPIRTPRSLYLTKDQVSICLKYGTVYRRFDGGTNNIQVTTSNLDRLHNDVFMTEDEYEASQKVVSVQENDKRGSVINVDIATEEEFKEEEKISEASIEEAKPEENLDENKVSEEDVNEEEVTSDEIFIEEVKSEENLDENEISEEHEKSVKNKQHNYNGKNNKYRKQ